MIIGDKGQKNTYKKSSQRKMETLERDRDAEESKENNAVLEAAATS